MVIVGIVGAVIAVCAIGGCVYYNSKQTQETEENEGGEREIYKKTIKRKNPIKTQLKKSIMDHEDRV